MAAAGALGVGVDKVVVVAVVEGGEREDGSGSVNGGLNIDDTIEGMYRWLHDEHVFPFSGNTEEGLRRISQKKV